MTNPLDSASPAAANALDPIGILLHASGPVLFVNWALIGMAGGVWLLAILKALQLSRIASAEKAFELEAEQAQSPEQLCAVARRFPDAPGARIVSEMVKRDGDRDVIEALGKQALVKEEQRLGSLLGMLSTIGSAGPFIGLFGTVWGILDAFLRIGREKSASLPVVAPAIGEALISTAVGLFAAIPAVILFNALAKRADDMVARMTAVSETWVLIAAGRQMPRPVPEKRKERAAVRTPIPALSA
ncbi:MAG: MotA/TolQ/ExbB proton channel family protein [Polyangiaceae bacterium]|nr:MotA/TolQ/ExbB proton channel family protein [Polyangiaceae bacterium]